MAIPTLNTPIYAKRAGINVYDQADNASERVLFTSDSKDSYREWQTKDLIGYTTGKVEVTTKGTFIEVITKRWIKQKLSKNTPKGLFWIPGVNIVVAGVTNLATEWVRQERIAWVRESEDTFYTNDQYDQIESQSIQSRLAEAYDTLPKEYRATRSYQNDKGEWMLEFANGYRLELTKYEALSLVEKKNIALAVTTPSVAPIASLTDPNPSESGFLSNVPTWAIALGVTVIVTAVGWGVYYFIFKKRNNGRG